MKTLKKTVAKIERNIDAFNHENPNDNTKKMEILLHKQVKEVESLNMKIDNLENNVKNSQRKFKCENVDFTSVTEQGLISHRSKKISKSAKKKKILSIPQIAISVTKLSKHLRK